MFSVIGVFTNDVIIHFYATTEERGMKKLFREAYEMKTQIKGFFIDPVVGERVLYEFYKKHMMEIRQLI